MNLKMDELNNLGRLLIRDRFQQDGEVYLEGYFAPALEAWQTWSRLYSFANVRDVHANVLWEAADHSSSIIRYRADWDFDDVSVGNALYCGTLDLEPLLLILDLDTKWSERVFHGQDAWTCDGVPGWRETLQPPALPEENAKNVTLVPKWWDHEHCSFEFCWATISEHENTRAFVGISCYGSEKWVCQNCYESRVVPHSLPK